MNPNTQAPLKVLFSAIILIIVLSCTKDSDLYDQVVMADIDEEIETISEESQDEEESSDDENSDTDNDESEEESDDEESDEGNDDEESDQGDDDEGSDEGSNDEDSSSDEDSQSDDERTGSITFNTDFESVQWDKNGTPANGKWDLHGNAEVRSTSDARQGDSAIRLGGFNNDKNRNEIYVRRLLNWEESWIGWSMKVVSPLDAPRSYLQFRNMRASGGVGPGVINPLTISQGYKSDELLIKTSTNEKYVNTIWETNAVAGTQSHKTKYEVGEWVDFVVHWKLDPVDGFIQVWVNGKLVVNETGTTTYRYAHVDGEPYDGDIVNTLGPYWFGKKPHGDIYYDAFKVWQGSGGRYEDVSPLGRGPRD
jgi:hypothetical protein